MNKKTILATILLATFSLTAHAQGNPNAGNNNGGSPNAGNNNGPRFGGGGTTTTNATAVGIGVGVGKASSNATASGGNANVSSRNTNTNANNNRSTANQGQGQSVEINDSSKIIYEDNYRAPATAFAPALTTGVCMGSASAAFGNQYFSLGGGKTTIDEECQIRYNSIRLEQVGQVDAATLIMCQIESTKLALEQSGFICPVGAPTNTNNQVRTSGNSLKPMWE